MIEEEERVKWWKNPVKFFIHGVSFSVLFWILFIVWSLMFVVLVAFGAFIGVIIGFVILVYIVGGLNCFLTDKLWFPVETQWKSVLAHGFYLFIVLVVVDFALIILPMILLPSVATRIISFIIVTFIDGYAAKYVAESWRVREGGLQEKRVAEPFFRREWDSPVHVKQ